MMIGDADEQMRDIGVSRFGPPRLDSSHRFLRLFGGQPGVGQIAARFPSKLRWKILQINLRVFPCRLDIARAGCFKESFLERFAAHKWIER